jgi:predicted DNA-binding transcriptional regulator AlpA
VGGLFAFILIFWSVFSLPASKENTAMKTRCDAAPADKLLKVPEIMDELQVSRSEVYKLIRTGRLQSVQFPGSGDRHMRRVKLSEVRRFIDAHTVGGSTGVAVQ